MEGAALPEGEGSRSTLARIVTFRRAAAVTILAAVVALVFALGLDGERREPPASATRTPAVLVVPFDARGAGAEIETLASGITAQLIADLMRFPDFRLYTYADSLRQDADGAQEAGAVDFVVRGVVSGDPDSLSVVVRLEEAGSGRIVWSEAYTRPRRPSALVGMQAEIAGEIASGIGQPYGALRDEIAARLAADTAGATGADMSSFACVMQAYTYRHSNSSALYAPVRACLEEAVARDPDYAEAWAMLSYLRLDAGRFGYEARSEQEREDAYAAARVAAARALALDPGSTQALKALSTIDYYSGRYEESHQLAREALARNPNDPDTLGQIGWRLSLRGNFDEGIPLLTRAIERSARPPTWYFQPIALERLVAGDMAGMLVAAQQAAADGSAASEALLAIAHGGLGQAAEARAALDRMAATWPLLGTDPAEALRRHHVAEELIEAMVAGLRVAGWEPPVRGPPTAAGHRIAPASRLRPPGPPPPRGTRGGAVRRSPRSPRR